MGHILPRSNSAKLAATLLKQSNVKLFVFIEDQNLEVVYEKIIANMTKLKNTEINIQNLSGRKNVLEIYNLWTNNEKLPNHTVFIIDKDYKHLKESLIIRNDHLVELNCYAIENHLVNQFGVTKMVKHISPAFNEDNIGYKDWLTEFHMKTKELFLHYALAYKFDLKKNNSISAFKYLEKGDYDINLSIIEEYITDVKCKMSERNLNYYNERNVVISYFQTNNSIDYGKLINGKYQLRFLLKYLHTILEEKIQEREAYYILSDFIDENSCAYLASSLNAVKKLS